MAFKLKAKIWVENNNVKVFGDGPCDILTRVERTGSLSKAAAEINMSYSQAWRLISMLEKNLGFTILEKQAGGPEGGHSTLTPEAKILTKAYHDFREEAERSLQELFEKYLQPLEEKLDLKS